MSPTNKHAWLIAVFVFLSGCATVRQDAGFSEVSASVEERNALKIVWSSGARLDQQVGERLRSLVKEKLTVDEAVQVALLNNRELQAIYSDLGVAQADLVQAGLLKNPIFDGAILYSMVHGGPPDLELSVVMNFLDIFYLPLRKRVAAARFEEAKLRVAGAVLDFAAQVRIAFFAHQANEQMLDLRQTTLEALAISLDVARRLHEAGNITDLDLDRERAQTETAKLQLAASEMAARRSREDLNGLMGLWGSETAWETAGRLPQSHIKPGETVKYEWTLRQHGTFMYHSHHDEMTQMGMGQIGSFIIHPRNPTPEYRVDRDFLLMLSEWVIEAGTARPNTVKDSGFNILTINGKSFPSTAPLVCKTGDRVRIRLGNLGAMDHHPIHLHGFHFRITATDGEDIPLSAQWPETTVLVAVGQTRNIEFIADAPGDWAMHCHMTHHVMNQMGHDFPNMVGMKPGDLDEKLRPLLPTYMTMGHTGMDMGKMAELAPYPRNTIP